MLLFVTGEWAYISNHVTVKGEGGGEGSLTPLPLSPQLTKYYHALVSAIFGHSNTIFQVRIEQQYRANIPESYLPSHSIASNLILIKLLNLQLSHYSAA